MNSKQIYEFLKNKSNPKISDLQDLRMLVQKYPYFQAGIFIYLKSVYLFDNRNFNDELKEYSIFVNDRKALFFYILSEEYNVFFTHIQKQNLGEDRTNVLLNAFFETHDPQDSLELEYTLSHSSLASADYFSYIENVEKTDMNNVSISEKEETNLKHHEIIDSFIEKSDEEGYFHLKLDLEKENIAPPSQITTEEQDSDELNDDLFFTETLAKIYTKQRKYDKAYKIIKHLSLNYPKKNIYFADQLSFLEKLIINSKYKDKK